MVGIFIIGVFAGFVLGVWASRSSTPASVPPDGEPMVPPPPPRKYGCNPPATAPKPNIGPVGQGSRTSPAPPPKDPIRVELVNLTPAQREGLVTGLRTFNQPKPDPSHD